MRINEVEEQLGIPKATIRFYEKTGLLSPARKTNNYREYSEEDLLQLQNIVILRKLGISVQDIAKLQAGERTLQETMQSNIQQLEEQVHQLEGSLRLSKQIAWEGDDQLDTPRYWQMIQEQEAAGDSFGDVVDDFWDSLMIPALRMRFHIPEGERLRDALPWILLGNTLFALSKTFLWKEGGFIENFFYWPGIFLVVGAIIFPIFWLEKRNHLKLADFFWKLLMTVCFGILGLVALFFVGGFLNILWQNFFGS